jgi:hypothetical protein
MSDFKKSPKHPSPEQPLPEMLIPKGFLPNEAEFMTVSAAVEPP